MEKIDALTKACIESHGHPYKAVTDKINELVDAVNSLTQDKKEEPKPKGLADKLHEASFHCKDADVFPVLARAAVEEVMKKINSIEWVSYQHKKIIEAELLDMVK